MGVMDYMFVPHLFGTLTLNKMVLAGGVYGGIIRLWQWSSHDGISVFTKRRGEPHPHPLPTTQQKAAPAVPHFLNFLFAPESLT